MVRETQQAKSFPEISLVRLGRVPCPLTSVPVVVPCCAVSSYVPFRVKCRAVAVWRPPSCCRASLGEQSHDTLRARGVGSRGGWACRQRGTRCFFFAFVRMTVSRRCVLRRCVVGHAWPCLLTGLLHCFGCCWFGVACGLRLDWCGLVPSTGVGYVGPSRTHAPS